MMETTTFSQLKTLKDKKFWYLGLAIVVVMPLIIFIGLIGQQKLQNDQIELAQPDTSQTFTGTLASLPLFGQTIVSRQAGLRGIYIPISVESTPHGAGGELRLHLRTGPTAAEDIRTATVSIAELADQSLARFTFGPLPASFNERYYFFIEPIPGPRETTIKLSYGQPTAYGEGALYIAGEPQEAQAAFFLAYQRGLIGRDWTGWFFESSPHVAVLLCLTFLPGGAVLVWLWPGNLRRSGQAAPLNHIEWLALAAGLSVALYPILLLGANVSGIKLGRGVTTALLGLSGAAILTKGYLAYRTGDRPGFPTKGTASILVRLRETLLRPPHLLFWIIFVLSAGARSVIIRGQEMPLWQDSYHHTMISQLLVEQGGLFESWVPYAPIESFSYHFGFHAFVAMYQWLTGGQTALSLLAAGQLLNLLTVLLAFLLGRRLAGDSWTGVFAALITGLLSNQPMFYVNWGRYTQLAGQVILPVTLILSWRLVRTEQRNYNLIVLTTLAVSGLALTHYRVLLFYPCFLLPLLLLTWSQANWRRAWFIESGLRLGAVAGGSFLILLPWLWRVVDSRLLVNTVAFFKPAASKTEFVQTLTATTPSLFDHVAPVLVMLAGVGLMWGAWRRRAGIIVVAGWGLMLIAVANPHFFGLPGAGIVTYFAVLIAAYLPVSVLAGFTLAQIVRPLLAWSRLIGGGALLVVVLIGLGGALARAASFEPRHRMVTPSDLAAMEWIVQNTPPEATFWINARSGYGGTAVVGTDAGWWIPLLTHRRGLILPLVAGSEMTRPAAYPFQITSLYQRLRQTDFTSKEAWQILQQTGVTHIYIGQQRGAVWRGPEDPLDPAALENSPYYRPVYKQDRVRIFEVVRQP